VKKTECSKCHGTGTQVHFMQAGFQMASTCNACGGSGVTVPSGGECHTCSGDGVVRQRKTIKVNVPSGVEDGMRIKVPGEGHMPAIGQADEESPRWQRGDLFVNVRVAADTRFSRSGSDVLYTATIPFTTAMLGGKIKVPTLDGQVNVNVPTGTGSGDQLRLAGLGMHKLTSRRGAKGDLRVLFKVDMPKYLSANQRTIAEMLAEEMGDKTATRTMLKSNIQNEDGIESDHKNEGFLKSAWHTLTGQHKNLQEKESKADTDNSKGKAENEEKKKASGSG